MADASFNLFGANTAAPAPGVPRATKSKTELAKSNTEYGDAVAKTDTAEKATAKAVEEAKVPQAAQDKAAANTAQAEKNLSDSKAREEAYDDASDAAEVKKDAAIKEQAEQDRLIEDNNEKIADMGDDPNSASEKAALEAQNKVAREKSEAAGLEAEKQATLEKDNDAFSDAEDKSQDALDDKIDDAEDAEEITQDKLDDANDKVEDAQEAEDDAREDEVEVRDDQAEKYPNSFGKDVDKMKAEEEAEAQQAADDQAVIDKAVEEEKEKELEVERARVAEEARIAAEKRRLAIEKLKEEIESGEFQGDAVNAKIQELEDMQAIAKSIERDKNETLNNILAAQLAAKLSGKDHNAAYLYFDAPSTMGAEGTLENIIADKMQPIMKHAYIGEFPTKLQDLDWLVKSMDRPKVDIEYIEQIRNNVKRQYPIKYNFGDLSLTFLDDVHHKSIMTLQNYFSKDIWKHNSIKAGGTFLLRESVVIPEMIIWDLTVETDRHLKYIYKNVSMVSYDFDAYDDYEDGGTHSIQAVFKIEGLEVVEGGSPRTLNLANDPIWF